MLIDLIKQYSGIIKTIHKYQDRYEYFIMDNDEFHAVMMKKQFARTNAIYTQEILFRSHIAAITTIIRNEKWIDGIVLGIDNSNYYVFSSSLRGLTEAAADSVYTLQLVPLTIAQNYYMMQEALHEKIDNVIVCSEELESALIHFTHAMKQSKKANVPYYHKAKTSKEYLSELNIDGSGDVNNLYDELCQVTHPAERTVAMFTHLIEGTEDKYTIRTNLDLLLIKELINKHSRAFSVIFEMSFNSALLTLRVLNMFNDKRIYTKGVDDINFENVSGFKKIINSIYKTGQ